MQNTQLNVVPLRQVFGSKGQADDIDCGICGRGRRCHSTLSPAVISVRFCQNDGISLLGITLDAAGVPVADDGTPDCGSGPEAAALGICGWRNAVYEIPATRGPSAYKGCFIDVSGQTGAPFELGGDTYVDPLLAIPTPRNCCCGPIYFLDGGFP